MMKIEASKDQLYKHVEFLTTLRPFRNYQNLQSLKKVCDYLKAEFQHYGLEAREQNYTVEGEQYQNIIASYNPAKSKRMIVGGHYDVCGDQPGADDNASAVAGLLESARMTAEASPDIDYGIDFVAYCLEEPPFFDSENMGSFKHAESVKEQKEHLIGVINYEMIGYFNDKEQPYPDPRLKAIFPEKANFIAVVGKQKYHDFNQKVYELMKADAGIDVQMIDDPMIEGLAGMSDQRSYWEFDIPALMINDTSFIRNSNYHQMSDDIDTLSFDHMREVVSATYQAIVGF
jgi:Zn-dependent M28 family amino/carboxypeptidase